MTVIETSKILLECADWHDQAAKNSDISQLSEMHNDFSKAIRLVVIPEPEKEEKRMEAN